jgi:hypothetical protein
MSLAQLQNRFVEIDESYGNVGGGVGWTLHIESKSLFTIVCAFSKVLMAWC